MPAGTFIPPNLEAIYETAYNASLASQGVSLGILGIDYLEMVDILGEISGTLPDGMGLTDEALLGMINDIVYDEVDPEDLKIEYTGPSQEEAFGFDDVPDDVAENGEESVPADTVETIIDIVTDDDDDEDPLDITGVTPETPDTDQDVDLEIVDETIPPPTFDETDPDISAPSTDDSTDDSDMTYSDGSTITPGGVDTEAVDDTALDPSVPGDGSDDDEFATIDDLASEDEPTTDSTVLRQLYDAIINETDPNVRDGLIEDYTRYGGLFVDEAINNVPYEDVYGEVPPEGDPTLTEDDSPAATETGEGETTQTDDLLGGFVEGPEGPEEPQGPQE